MSKRPAKSFFLLQIQFLGHDKVCTKIVGKGQNDIDQGQDRTWV